MSENMSNSPAPSQPDKKKPFYKKWWVWVIAILIVIGGANSNPKNGGHSSNSSSSVSSSHSSSLYGARQFIEKRLTNTVGRVVEIRRVPNGAYFGFPDGSNIYTFDGTCWTNYGSKNVVVAVQGNGDDYEVIKININ